MSFKRKLYERVSKERHNKHGFYCSYKKKNCIHYESQQKAEHALQFIDEYTNPNYVPVRAYHCKCGYWHLTSTF